MSTLALPELTALGLPVDTNDAAFGWLRSSEDLLGDPTALRTRLEDDGYLFIRNFFPQEIIRTARLSMLRRLDGANLLDKAYPLEDGIATKDKSITFMPELARDNPDVQRVVFGPEIVGFYEKFFGGPIRHFDYIWVRSLGRGHGTSPHCDLVYMGRGTHRLLTCWIPYGEVPVDQSPLMLLENSHKKSARIKNYLESDVDTYCENRPEQVRKVKEEGGWSHAGWLSNNPVSLREKFGGRWLTAQFQPGDFLTFRMDMIHGSLDNATDRVRLSTDTRYQPANEPIDERWIGANPAAHGKAGKRGRIC
ncbi:MAG: phytanoyl-CoA dioxygenase family protein [Opitutaceae bacterium]|nr:phytanoyl-CoA dioxygenase family protein [Opitutaceae bacterium]